jgi:CDP-paratose 2-epimerase
LLAEKHVRRLAGSAFNIGGGVRNAISLLDLLDRIEHFHGKRPSISFQGWRPGDQRYYVSDTTGFEEATGWKARIGVDEGIQRLYRWLRDERSSARLPSRLTASTREPGRAAHAFTRVEEAR